MEVGGASPNNCAGQANIYYQDRFLRRVRTMFDYNLQGAHI